MTLFNPSEEAIRFNPSRVTAHVDATPGVIAPIAWQIQATGDWMALKPGGRLSGRVSVLVTLSEDVTSLWVMIGHLWLGFPLPRVWVGYLTTEVPLPASER